MFLVARKKTQLSNRKAAFKSSSCCAYLTRSTNRSAFRCSVVARHYFHKAHSIASPNIARKRDAPGVRIGHHFQTPLFKLSRDASRRRSDIFRPRQFSKQSQAESPVLGPKISVIGVGGGGGNAVTNMVTQNIQGISFYAANTDIQALNNMPPGVKKVLLGESGLGAGGKWEIGKKLAEESLAKVEETLALIDAKGKKNIDMLFLAAGLGGGTGTGASPVIARLARSKDILTVAVVTTPFLFEGPKKSQVAKEALEALKREVDTLIVVPNERLLSLDTSNDAPKQPLAINLGDEQFQKFQAHQEISLEPPQEVVRRQGANSLNFREAFLRADQVLSKGVKGISDLMVMPGVINLDFADVEATMKNSGRAMFGIGESEGRDRAKEAVHQALHNPLIEIDNLQHARSCLISVAGGKDLGLHEVNFIATTIQNKIDPEAEIIFGSTFDESLDGKVRVSVVLAGLEKHSQANDPVKKKKKLDDNLLFFFEISHPQTSFLNVEILFLTFFFSTLQKKILFRA